MMIFLEHRPEARVVHKGERQMRRVHRDLTTPTRRGLTPWDPRASLGVAKPPTPWTDPLNTTLSLPNTIGRALGSPFYPRSAGDLAATTQARHRAFGCAARPGKHGRGPCAPACTPRDFQPDRAPSTPS